MFAAGFFGSLERVPGELGKADAIPDRSAEVHGGAFLRKTV
jgi:hypothetical protein